MSWMHCAHRVSFDGAMGVTHFAMSNDDISPEIVESETVTSGMI